MIKKDTMHCKSATPSSAQDSLVFVHARQVCAYMKDETKEKKFKN